MSALLLHFLISHAASAAYCCSIGPVSHVANHVESEPAGWGETGCRVHAVNGGGAFVEGWCGSEGQKGGSEEEEEGEVEGNVHLVGIVLLEKYTESLKDDVGDNENFKVNE